jgi:hypothetical protein
MLQNPKFEINLTARLTLLDAANYIEAHGWCRDALEHEGRVCIFGAIRAVIQCDNMAVDREIVERLRRVTGRYMNVAAWNDKVCRSKKQAVAALRRAAR